MKYYEKTVSTPDMGLEPMTLRLKVWFSTDWANRAHMFMMGVREKNCFFHALILTLLEIDKMVDIASFQVSVALSE